MNLSEVRSNQKTAIAPYISRGIKISQSAHHKDLFIFSYPDGGFFSISSTAETIQMLHPKDIVEIFREKEKFKFNRTSNYTPTKHSIEKQRKEKRFTTRLT